MNEQCRHYLDYRKDAYLKDNLLYKIIVFKKGVCPARYRLGKIKPRDYAHYKPQNVWKIHIAPYIGRTVRHYNTEYEPVKKDRDNGRYKGPEYAEIRSRVLGLKVVFRQLPDKPPVLIKFNRKDDYLIEHFQENNIKSLQNNTGDDLFNDLLCFVRQGIMMQYYIQIKCQHGRRHDSDQLLLP